MFNYLHIIRGEYLACPEEMKSISWPAEDFYNQITTKCFVINPNQRIKFMELTRIIESVLDENERLNYMALANQYNNEDKTMFSNEIHVSGGTKENQGGKPSNACCEFKEQIGLPTTNGYLKLPNIISQSFN